MILYFTIYSTRYQITLFSHFYLCSEECSLCKRLWALSSCLGHSLHQSLAHFSFICTFCHCVQSCQSCCQSCCQPPPPPTRAAATGLSTSGEPLVVLLAVSPPLYQLLTKLSSTSSAKPHTFESILMSLIVAWLLSCFDQTSPITQICQTALFTFSFPLTPKPMYNTNLTR